MWHVGVHIWQVPVDQIEPNYDEYYAVSIGLGSDEELANNYRLSWRSIS
jgi:hypothetical protein